MCNSKNVKELIFMRFNNQGKFINSCANCIKKLIKELEITLKEMTIKTYLFNCEQEQEYFIKE